MLRMPKQKLGFRSKSHLADMSLPAEQRRKKKTGKRKKSKRAIAQMDHANGSPRINDQRRKFEKQNKRK
jgi:hypothetical protein